MGRSHKKKKLGVIIKKIEILRFENFFLRSKKRNITKTERRYWILLNTFFDQFFMQFHMPLDLRVAYQRFKSYGLRHFWAKNLKNLEKFQAKIIDQLQSAQICLKLAQNYQRRPLKMKNCDFRLKTQQNVSQNCQNPFWPFSSPKSFTVCLFWAV